MGQSPRLFQKLLLNLLALLIVATNERDFDGDAPVQVGVVAEKHSAESPPPEHVENLRRQFRPAELALTIRRDRDPAWLDSSVDSTGLMLLVNGHGKTSQTGNRFTPPGPSAR